MIRQAPNTALGAAWANLLVTLGAQFGVLNGTDGQGPGHEPGEYERARGKANAGESLSDSG